jgi:hypothetical protein
VKLQVTGVFLASLCLMPGVSTNAGSSEVICGSQYSAISLSTPFNAASVTPDYRGSRLKRTGYGSCATCELSIII